MAPSELKAEWNYRYHERIGIMVEDGDPTPQQDKIARQEADQAVARLKREEVAEPSPRPA